MNNETVTTTVETVAEKVSRYLSALAYVKGSFTPGTPIHMYIMNALDSTDEPGNRNIEWLTELLQKARAGLPEDSRGYAWITRELADKVEPVAEVPEAPKPLTDYELNQLIQGTKKVFFGKRKSDGRNIFLTKPSWDCGWYWGFGYLGNNNEHYHLDGYQNGRNINMYDALVTDYELAPFIRKHLWVFCELVLTAYTLKDTAEVLGRGGSHMTKNPLRSLIISEGEVERINKTVLPAIFQEIQDLVEGKGAYAPDKTETEVRLILRETTEQTIKVPKYALDNLDTLKDYIADNGNPKLLAKLQSFKIVESNPAVAEGATV